MPRRTRQQQVIWATGFFDGEGCIGIYRMGNRYSLTLSVSQVVDEPLEILMALWGGSIHWQGDNFKGGVGWQWTCVGHQAYAALVEMTPWMRVKKDQAKLAMKFFPKRLDHEKGKQFSDDLKILKRVT